jgi:hypothetical protein
MCKLAQRPKLTNRGNHVMNTVKHKVAVACTNANGEADLFVTTVEVTTEQIALGEHYDIAESKADEEGYSKPFICFDEHEQSNLKRGFNDLNVTELVPNHEKLKFKLFDEEAGDEISGNFDSKNNLGVAIFFDGYGDCTSQDDSGTPVYIEKFDGKLQVRIYADINSEDPTHNISLEGARLEKRKPDNE